MRIAEIGDNLPPEDDFDRVERQIGEFYDEAKVWLDGDPIDSQGIADGVATLLRALQDCGKEAETMRKEEKKPHDEAGKAVQAKYKPLSDNVKRAVDACKQTMAPWEKKKREEQEARAAELARIAEEKKREAEEKLRASAGNIAEREKAEDSLKVAVAHEAQAAREARKTGGTKVGGSKALGIRKTPVPEISDAMEAIIHYYSQDRHCFDELLLKLARQDIAAKVQTIPGIAITNRETVV